jgi:hypothetical protein
MKYKFSPEEIIRHKYEVSFRHPVHCVVLNGTLIYVVASKCYWNHCNSENTAQYIHLSIISSKTVPLYKYALLPATVKVLETFLKAIFRKTFQVVHVCLMISGASQKRRAFNAALGSGNR